MPLPYQQPPVQPAFHTIIPSSVPIHGYAFQPCLGPYPSVETPLMKHGSDTSIQPLVPPVNGIHAVNFSDVRPNMQEPGAWHHQRPFNSRDNIHMQQSIGPRAFPRPPYYGPMPGFMGRPGLPGNYIISMRRHLCLMTRCLHPDYSCQYFEIMLKQKKYLE